MRIRMGMVGMRRCRTESECGRAGRDRYVVRGSVNELLLVLLAEERSMRLRAVAPLRDAQRDLVRALDQRA